jgi:hypothetical protein
VYPEAVFLDSTFALEGQRIYLAATVEATQTKGRGFNIPLDRFQAADPANLRLPLTLNWTTCFAGSSNPCMSVGQHTVKARLTGNGSKITGSLVVVYRDRRHQ